MGATILTAEERVGMEREGIDLVLTGPPYDHRLQGITWQICTHRYRGEGTTIEAQCGVSLVVRGDMAVVVLTEQPGNPGRSVTNAMEQLATEVYASHLVGRVAPGRVAWIEHYEQGMPANGQTFDRVRLGHAYQDGNVRFYGPKWQRMKGNTQ